MDLRFNTSGKNYFKRLSLFLLFAVVFSPVFAQLPQKIEDVLKNHPGEYQQISNIKKLPIDANMKNPFKEKYEMFITQPIDHSNPALGTYKQRFVVSVADYNAPTVIVTEGYSAQYAVNPRYREEVSKLFNTNLVVVEHRYFQESIPFMQDDSTLTDETLNWNYMTAVNEAADLHNVNRLLKNIFPGKWIATGISKGGQTTMFYTAYYPKDIDISVPYVGPLCKGVEDGRHEPFIANYAGTAAEREIIKNFQREVLKRRANIKPLFDKMCADKGYTFKMDLDAVYDYCVLEFSFAFWQWGTAVSTIPDVKTASDKEIFDYFVKIAGMDYFAENSANANFFVQAAKELGYYGYDTKDFKDLLSIKSTKDYMKNYMLPQTQTFKFDKYLYKKVKGFLAKTDSKMMFIYGQFDPWSSVMPVAPVKNEALKAKGKGRENMVLFIDPNGSHRARIGTLPDSLQQEAINILTKWLQE